MQFDRTFILGVFIFLILWANLISDIANQLISQNPVLFYAVFIALYLGLVLYFIFDINPISDIRFFLSWVLIFLAFDIMLYPMLITKNGLTQLPPEAQASSDVFIYKMLPTMPELLKYNIVYVVVPTLFFIAAFYIAGKRQFSNMVKQHI